MKSIKEEVRSMHAMLGNFVSGSKEKIELERAIRKAIAELDETKSSFRSRRIMQIKEDLEKALHGR